MNIDYKWLVVGILLGYFVIPRLHAAVMTRSAKSAA